eukprot:866362-Amphidinium_carterae.1
MLPLSKLCGTSYKDVWGGRRAMQRLLRCGLCDGKTKAAKETALVVVCEPLWSKLVRLFLASSTKPVHDGLRASSCDCVCVCVSAKRCSGQ